MNFLTSYKRLFIITLLGGLTMSPLLTSCGSSGGGDTTTAGIGGTGITQGKITGFGSIFVNGVEFDTDLSEFEVDGDTSLDEDALRIGMVVKISGSVSSDGLTGNAENVEYDDDIQGPISNIADQPDGQRILTIFDKTVTIDESTTSFDGTNFASIEVNDIVEVSGFNTSATEIEATFVKKTGNLISGDTEVEIKGTIASLSMTNFVLEGTGIVIEFDNNTEIEVPGGTLSDGLFVEVEGDFQSATSILAKEIEAEDEDDFEDGEEISLQGIISNFMSDSDFMINGQAVNASGAERSPANLDLADGQNIEVEGNIVDGVLIAEEVELREGEAKLKTFVSNVNTNTGEIVLSYFTGTVTIDTDTQTQFEDEAGSNPLDDMSLSDIVQNDFIVVEGIASNGQVIASSVKRKDADDVEIQGAVENYTRDAFITLLGISFSVNINTDYEDGSLTSDEFFDSLDIQGLGTVVEIVDNDSAIGDGFADEVEFD